MNTKHTPGAWYTPEDSFTVRERVENNPPRIVCQTKTVAEARLIAAAPELLAAIKRVVMVMEYVAQNAHMIDAHYLPEGKALMDAANHALEVIAKAEGTV